MNNVGKYVEVSPFHPRSSDQDDSDNDSQVVLEVPLIFILDQKAAGCDYSRTI